MVQCHESMECSLSINKPGQIRESLSVIQEVHKSIKIPSLKGFDSICNRIIFIGMRKGRVRGNI